MGQEQDPGLAPVTTLSGVGPALAEKLARLGIARLQDLWFHLPRQYEDRTRIVPILKEIGLFGPKVQKALGDMGVMGYADIDVEQLIANDLKVADDFDAKKFVNDAIAAE